jgi:hypothetical protein
MKMLHVLGGRARYSLPFQHWNMGRGRKAENLADNKHPPVCRHTLFVGILCARAAYNIMFKPASAYQQFSECTKAHQVIKKNMETHTIYDTRGAYILISSSGYGILIFYLKFSQLTWECFVDGVLISNIGKSCPGFYML